MKDLTAVLLQHPFFKGLSAAHLGFFERHAREIEFKAGQVVLHQNQGAHECYLITTGKVAVESYFPRGNDVPLQVIGGGDVLGWSWLFPPFVWHFQARALEPTWAIALDGASLLVACEKHHGFGYELMNRVAQVVIKRLQATRKHLVQLNPPEGLLAAPDELAQSEATSSVGKTLETQLSEHPFLRGIKAYFSRIMAQSAIPAEFMAGQLIFHEGEAANRFYLIQRGKVLIQLPLDDRSAVPIEIVGAGDVLGWSWLFEPFYWHFDARALEPTRAILLHATRLRGQCETDPDFGYELMKRITQVLIHRLQAARRQLLEVRACRNQTR